MQNSGETRRENVVVYLSTVMLAKAGIQ